MTEERPSPLDVLLTAMHACIDNDDVDGAVTLARHAAPFVHPRPQPAGPDANLRTIRDDQLDELCESGPGGADITAADKE